MNGGYIMLDFDGVELTSTGQEGAMTINGIYSATKAAIESGKMVVVTNCKYNGKVIAPLPVFAYDTRLGSPVTTIAIRIFDYNINVASGDLVIILVS